MDSTATFALPTDKTAAVCHLLDSIGQQGYLTAHVYDYYFQIDATSCFAVEQCETMLADISDPNWQPPNKKQSN